MHRQIKRKPSSRSQEELRVPLREYIEPPAEAKQKDEEEKGTERGVAVIDFFI